MEHIGNKSDLELIREFQAGSELAFETLISRYQGKAFSLANRLTKSSEDAEEVLQDVFTTVFRKIDGFEGKSSFSSWLYRVTVNSSLMKLRKKRRDPSVPLEDEVKKISLKASNFAPYQIEGEANSARLEVAVALEGAIKDLPDEYRPVFVLRDVDGLSSKEVGKILGLSIAAVKSRLHRSRLMLRRALSSFYADINPSTNEILPAGDSRAVLNL
jgi:RNA polymerase sigma-70 factor (ECF subfamily)